MAANRSKLFLGHRGFPDFRSLYLDEYRDRLFVGGKDTLYSLWLDQPGMDAKEVTLNLSAPMWVSRAASFHTAHMMHVCAGLGWCGRARRGGQRLGQGSGLRCTGRAVGRLELE